jgi:hypothetical protein
MKRYLQGGFSDLNFLMIFKTHNIKQEQCKQKMMHKHLLFLILFKFYLYIFGPNLFDKLLIFRKFKTKPWFYSLFLM